DPGVGLIDVREWFRDKLVAQPRFSQRAADMVSAVVEQAQPLSYDELKPAQLPGYRAVMDAEPDLQLEVLRASIAFLRSPRRSWGAFSGVLDVVRRLLQKKLAF